MTGQAEPMELPRVPLTEIHDHPANPRRAAVASPEMVDSIHAQGVLEPVMIAPRAEGGWWLIDGHRRKDGATRAGVDVVPVNPRHDLDTEAKQVEVMAITGLQKENLTAVEEAAAYEQLSLLGLDQAAIATATGFSRTRVRSRMRLNELSVKARDHIHGGQLTLGDAEAMLEFADDTEVTGRLEAALGTPEFGHQVHSARLRREWMTRNRARAAEYETRGIVGVPDDHPDARDIAAWRDTHPDLAEESGHTAGDDGCLGWDLPGGWESYSGVRLVCIAPDRHPAPVRAATTPVQSEWEAQREAREAAALAAAAASAARVEWLRGHVEPLIPTRGQAALAAALHALVPLLLVDGRELADARTLTRALGYAETGGQSAEDLLAEEATALAAAKPSKAIPVFARWLAGVIADQLDTDHRYLDEPEEIRHHLDLWDWLRRAGYPISEHDRERMTQLESWFAEVTELRAQNDGA